MEAKINVCDWCEQESESLTEVVLEDKQGDHSYPFGGILEVCPECGLKLRSDENIIVLPSIVQ